MKTWKELTNIEREEFEREYEELWGINEYNYVNWSRPWDYDPEEDAMDVMDYYNMTQGWGGP